MTLQLVIEKLAGFTDEKLLEQHLKYSRVAIDPVAAGHAYLATAAKYKGKPSAIPVTLENVKMGAVLIAEEMKKEIDKRGLTPLPIPDTF